MNITDIDQLILCLNREAQEGELEHHGSATTRFELRTDGEHQSILFMGIPIWKNWDDEREEVGDDGYEPLETFLRRESQAFMERMMAKPSPDVPDPQP